MGPHAVRKGSDRGRQTRQDAAVQAGASSRGGLYQEIKYVSAGDGGGNVVALQGAALVLLAVGPGPQGRLQNEHLARLHPRNPRRLGTAVQQPLDWEAPPLPERICNQRLLF